VYFVKNLLTNGINRVELLESEPLHAQQPRIFELVSSQPNCYATYSITVRVIANTKKKKKLIVYLTSKMFCEGSIEVKPHTTKDNAHNEGQCTK
jgi:hypothetical protein